MLGHRHRRWTNIDPASRGPDQHSTQQSRKQLIQNIWRGVWRKPQNRRRPHRTDRRNTARIPYTRNYATYPGKARPTQSAALHNFIGEDENDATCGEIKNNIAAINVIDQSRLEGRNKDISLKPLRNISGLIKVLIKMCDIASIPSLYTQLQFKV